MKLYLSTIVLGLVAILMFGCANPSNNDVSLPVKNASEARDVAFNYVHGNKGVEIPSRDMNWGEKNVSPPGLEEISILVYTSGQWVITISHSNIDPRQRLYEVVVANVTIGFKWKGIVKSDGSVMEVAISP